MSKQNKKKEKKLEPVDEYKLITRKSRIMVGTITASIILVLGAAISTSIYFGTRSSGGGGGGGGGETEVIPDPRIPILIDELGKFEIKDINRTKTSTTFKVEPKDGVTNADKLIIKIDNTELSASEYTFNNNLVTLPMSTLQKYVGNITVEPKFHDRTEIYFKYTTIHMDATDDTGFYIPYEVTDTAKIEWTSDNENFVKVDKDTGEVLLQKEAVEGTTIELNVTITATAVDSIASHKSDTCKIVILPTNTEKLDYVASKGENFDGYTVKAKAGTTLTGEIVIPGVYEGKPVVAVNALGFINQTGITKVTLPETVTSIGTQAFNGCTSLESINLPKAMFSIATAVFKNTSANLEINFENKHTKWSTYLGTTKQGEIDPITRTAKEVASDIKALADNINLTRQGVEDPNSNLMYYITSEITCSVAPKSSTVSGEVDIPAFVEFEGTTYKVNAILYDTINKASSFRSCTEITKITIPYTIEYITIGSFSTCSKLTYIDVDKDNPYYCSSKGVLYTARYESLLCYPCSYSGVGTSTKFELPQPTKRIELNSLSNSNIEEFSCAEDSLLTKVQSGAFYNCASLSSVHFPASLTFVDWYTFQKCTNLQEIIFDDKIGWSYYSGGTPDLTDPVKNAQNFTNTSKPECNDGIIK